MAVKLLGRKAYGHIPHLPGSRLGPGDHHCSPGQARIATQKARDSRDFITVTEKVDGSCCAVARIDGVIVPLVRAGYPACSSKYEQHQLFHQWVMAHQDRFLEVLRDGERIVGEWLAQAHGTRYELGTMPPFIVFDLMQDEERLTYEQFRMRIYSTREYFFQAPALIGSGPLSVETAMQLQNCGKPPYGWCGAQDPVEGAVWRVERDSKFDFICKWVRPDKLDGKYLPEVSGKDPVWNWRPPS